ncbi:MAG: helix-turn-helix transcriptional regulator [Thermomicrobiales bacterium]
MTDQEEERTMVDGRPRPMGTIVHLTPRDGRPRGRIIRLDTGLPARPGPGEDAAPTETTGPPGSTAAHPGWTGAPASVPLAPSPAGTASSRAIEAHSLPLPGMEDTRTTADARDDGDAWDDGIADPGPAVPRHVRVDDVALMAMLGRQLSEQRKRLGLSQYSLAAAISCDRSAVCRWESGNRMPSLVHLVGLCQVLGCSPATLLGMDPTGPVDPTPSGAAGGPDETEGDTNAAEE